MCKTKKLIELYEKLSHHYEIKLIEVSKKDIIHPNDIGLCWIIDKMRNSGFTTTEESLILERDFFKFKPEYVVEKEAYWFRDVEQRKEFLRLRISNLRSSIKSNKNILSKWMKLFNHKVV